MVVLLVTLLFTLHADTLRDEIARMLIVGFDGKRLDANSSLVRTIRRYPLGGVILFAKNLKTQDQVSALTHRLQALRKEPLLIGIDEEGGRVDRLAKIANGFKTPSAQRIASMKPSEAKRHYLKTAKALHRLGFNLDFAPVADLARNPQNRVIVKSGRSYGSDPRRVVAYASLFIDALHEEGVLAVLKHFPGHGSSAGDSHEGFTDVSGSWSPDELRPFMALRDKTDMVMSAHIFNRHLDAHYPATLSRSVIGTLLRQKMGYEGVVVSDDMQMGAIRKNYTLHEAVVLAINAGVDMLLFGNQIARPYRAETIIDLIASLVQKGEISRERIDEANRRIQALKREPFPDR